MMRVRYQLLVSFCLLMTLGWSTAALATTISGTVSNNSGKAGRIYLRVGWEDVGGTRETSLGVSIASAGVYTIRGLPDNGTFVVRGFVDVNGDGAVNISEPIGASGNIFINNGMVTGDANLGMYSPGVEMIPVAVTSLGVKPGDGCVMLSWEAPESANGMIQADTYRIEWSANNFVSVAGSKTIAVSGGMDDGRAVVYGLTNGVAYSFRIVSIVGAQTATSATVQTVAGFPTGGYSISGTINLNGASVAAGTPIVIMAETIGAEDLLYAQYLPTFANGTSFSLRGLPAGEYEVFALIDRDKNMRPNAGDYTALLPTVVVLGNSNVGNVSLPVDSSNVWLNVNTNHRYYMNLGVQQQIYWLSFEVKKQAKRPVNIYLTGPQLFAEGHDLNCEEDDDEFEFWYDAISRPLLTDQYSFVIGYSDGTSQTLTARPRVVYDSPVPNNITPGGAIVSMPADITWQPSTTVPPGWVSYAYLWGGASCGEFACFNWERDDEPPASLNRISYDGPPLVPGAYKLKVSLCEEIYWNCVSREQDFTVVAGTCAAPASLTVPVADADGAYTVSWGASTTAGVTYELQEATNNTFATGLRTVYTGTALSAGISGRSQNVTYFYRVRAKKPNYLDSSYRLANNGCAVPGTATAGVPASIAVPVADNDGVYTVSWGASVTAGVTYELQEATNSLFTAGLRTAYRGTARTVGITGRSQNVTYYYRVRAVKAGLKDSGYQVALSGCAVPGTVLVGMPASLTVPVTSATGAYTISWGASTTAGVTYELQEATSSNFSTGLRTAYRGAALTAGITGRSQNVTYYYRVRAVKAGQKDSGYRGAANSCAVPGTATAGVPASIAVPASDADGAYTVSWGASATAGVTYELQEATASNFSSGLRLAYRGPALSAGISGRVAGTTYYYRVRAVKGGLKDSAYRTATGGCRIGP